MIRNLEWMQQAACAQTNPEHFFPARGNVSKAVATCRSCPVLQSCQTYTREVEADLDRNEYFGVWAGQSSRARSTQTGTPRRSVTALHENIRRLSRRGLDAHTVANLTGCTTRTVWRVTSQDQDTFGEAA